MSNLEKNRFLKEIFFFNLYFKLTQVNPDLRVFSKNFSPFGPVVLPAIAIININVWHWKLTHACSPTKNREFSQFIIKSRLNLSYK